MALGDYLISIKKKMEELFKAPVTKAPIPQEDVVKGQRGAFVEKGGLSPMGGGVPTPSVTPMPSFVRETPSEYLPMIHGATEPYQDLSTMLLSALLSKESIGYSPDVISGKLLSPVGAQGVAQFMPSVISDLERMGYGKVDPFKPKEAIPASAWWLNHLLGETGGDLRNTLAAYNAGLGNIPAGYGYADDLLERISDKEELERAVKWGGVGE